MYLVWLSVNMFRNLCLETIALDFFALDKIWIFVWKDFLLEHIVALGKLPWKKCPWIKFALEKTALDLLLPWKEKCPGKNCLGTILPWKEIATICLGNLLLGKLP